MGGNQIRKLMALAVRPRVWRGLIFGVAAAVEHENLVRRLAPTTLIDVGANNGQFSLMARALYPDLRIVAFEPLQRETRRFRRAVGGGSRVLITKCAIGARPGRALIHVSARRDSSSLLPIGALQSEVFAGTGQRGIEEVELVSLDGAEVLDEVCDRALLKIDVQGSELDVLRGATRLLSRVRWVYVECSSVELYEGQPLVNDVRGFLESRGWRLEGAYNSVSTRRLGLVQADYLFERSIPLQQVDS